MLLSLYSSRIRRNQPGKIDTPSQKKIGKTSDLHSNLDRNTNYPSKDISWFSEVPLDESRSNVLKYAITDPLHTLFSLLFIGDIGHVSRLKITDVSGNICGPDITS
jgi:hypothetical protein